MGKSGSYESGVDSPDDEAEDWDYNAEEDYHPGLTHGGHGAPQGVRRGAVLPPHVPNPLVQGGDGADYCRTPAALLCYPRRLCYR